MNLEFLTSHFENCIWLLVLLIAICPTLESKIAIPLAMNSTFWGSNAYSPFMALTISFLGSILPCYFIMLLARKVKGKTIGFFTSRLLQKYNAKCSKIDAQTSNLKKYLLLTCLVAVPIPLTGVWTGSIISGLSNLNIKYCFVSITIGAFISASAITLLCSLFNNSLTYIMIISILIIICFLFIELFISYLKNNKKKEI